MSKKEEKAEQYANQKIKDKNLYPCVEFSRRKQLTTFDAYELADAFEDGWDAAKQETIECLKTILSLRSDVHPVASKHIIELVEREMEE